MIETSLFWQKIKVHWSKTFWQLATPNNENEIADQIIFSRRIWSTHVLQIIKMGILVWSINQCLHDKQKNRDWLLKFCCLLKRPCDPHLKAHCLRSHGKVNTCFEAFVWTGWSAQNIAFDSSTSWTSSECQVSKTFYHYFAMIPTFIPLKIWPQKWSNMATCFDHKLSTWSCQCHFMTPAVTHVLKANENVR